MKLFLPNQKVPMWLQIVRPQKGCEHDCRLTQPVFASPVLVWKQGNRHMLYNLIPFATFINCDAENAILDGSAGVEGQTAHFIHNHIESLRYLPMRLKYKFEKLYPKLYESYK